jgi:hypothetical protein
MRRATLIGQIETRLGDQSLVWFGTRGDDVEAAVELEQLAASVSIINAYTRRATVAGVALEDIVGTRFDLDTFDIDADPRDEGIVELRHVLLRLLARPSAVFTYRPSDFLSAVCFARSDRCTYLGMFSGHQAAFEHKPWVESAVGELGIARVEWTYVSDDDRGEVTRMLRDGPVVLRRSRTNGGVGLVRVDDDSDLYTQWPDEDEAFVSAAPFLRDAVPVNVGAVVWHDGVTVHPASVQLIGIPGCTSRPFGYCGNDFGAARDLGEPAIATIESAVQRIGGWLRARGYVGAYGVDFLVKDGVPRFIEVNPRFQGSTHLSCQISIEMGESCILTEHIAACLGMDAPVAPPLRELVSAVGARAHVVVHHDAPWSASLDAVPLVQAANECGRLRRADVLTHPGLRAEPGAATARLTFDERLTDSGFELHEPLRSVIRLWSDGAFGAQARRTTTREDHAVDR